MYPVLSISASLCGINYLNSSCTPPPIPNTRAFHYKTKMASPPFFRERLFQSFPRIFWYSISVPITLHTVLCSFLFGLAIPDALMFCIKNIQRRIRVASTLWSARRRTHTPNNNQLSHYFDFGDDDGRCVCFWCCRTCEMYVIARAGLSSMPV